MDNRISGKRTNSKHLPIGANRITEVEPVVVEDVSTDLVSGMNNVDIETEMVDQVKNEIRFLFASKLISRNFAAIRASIKGRFDM